MPKIFYFGTDNKVYGPVSELDCQGWYACGYLSSEIKFQISKCDRFDPQGRLYTLGELIDLNGRTLPFYFSQEKEEQEKKQEERLNQLTQELTALRKMCHESSSKSAEKADVAALQKQVASLTESHSTLLLQLKELSNKKERTPPVPPNLEKNMGEQKKRLDENEKNVASMKKEISAINSKCDRTETKMEKFTEKQKEVDEKLNGYDKRICALKDAEKLIKDNLKECEQTASSTSTLVQSCNSQQSEMKKEMEEQKTESATIRSDLETVKQDIGYLNAAVGSIQQSAMEALLREKIEAEKVTKMEARGVRCERKTEPFSLNDAEDLPPWEKEETECPFEVEPKPENEPWNSSKKEPAKTENGNSINQSVKRKEKAPSKKTISKVPLVKNWDAILRDISDDDDADYEDARADDPRAVSAKGGKAEEAPQKNEPKAGTESNPLPEPSSTMAGPPAAVPLPNEPLARPALLQNILDARPHVPKQNRQLIDKFMNIFRTYLTAMRTKQLATMAPGEIMLNQGIYDTLLEWHSESSDFTPLAQRLLNDIPKLCDEMELTCWECPCRLFTTGNVIDHLVDPNHLMNMAGLSAVAHLYGTVVQRALGKLCNLLKKLAPLKRELHLNSKGTQLYLSLKGSERLRPTREFVRAKLQQCKILACAGDERAIMLANVGGALNPVNDAYFTRVLRKWFRVEENRLRFLKELEEHISTGVPHCSECEVAYESKDDFYKHVTSYGHARVDQRMFGGMFLRLARGTQDWDVTM